MYYFQIALDGNACQVDNRSSSSAPIEVCTKEQSAHPVANRPIELDIAKLDRIAYSHHEAGEKIKSILIDNQHVLLVLF